MNFSDPHSNRPGLPYSTYRWLLLALGLGLIFFELVFFLTHLYSPPLPAYNEMSKSDSGRLGVLRRF